MIFHERKEFETKHAGYSKTVLRKMSFSKRLFLKEYRKSLAWLNPEERTELKKWVREAKEEVRV